MKKKIIKYNSMRVHDQINKNYATKKIKISTGHLLLAVRWPHNRHNADRSLNGFVILDNWLLQSYFQNYLKFKLYNNIIVIPSKQFT